MDISMARRLVELEKEGRKVLVALWEGDTITACATAEEAKQACEICQGDDELCNSYIEYLKGKGYQATEIELGEKVEEGLPGFLQERELISQASSVIEVDTSAPIEPELIEDAIASSD